MHEQTLSLEWWGGRLTRQSKRWGARLALQTRRWGGRLARQLATASSVLAIGLLMTGPAHAREQWTPEEANAWYAQQPWYVGSNFNPSTTINQLEMWQADTFDPETIDRELGWAAAIGFNAMRVYLHDLLWQQDPQGFLERLDAYLAIADTHGIRTMFVLFDAVWHPHPKLGPQPAPKPHLHNSGWVQSPHTDILRDPARHGELAPYVQGVIGRFRNDPRVFAWDLYNEPDNPNQLSYGELEFEDKPALALALLKKTFAWARAQDPVQALTAGVWRGAWGNTDRLSDLNRYIFEASDIITFHSYTPPKRVERVIQDLQTYGRPIICTEYMARTNGSTFQGVLPIFKREGVGAINWGLVSGKSQTIYSWTSWVNLQPREPETWFHDVFHPDGTPYDENETKLIRDLTRDSR